MRTLVSYTILTTMLSLSIVNCTGGFESQSIFEELESQPSNNQGNGQNSGGGLLTNGGATEDAKSNSGADSATTLPPTSTQPPSSPPTSTQALSLRSSSFIDGGRGDLVRDVAFDSQGNIYLTGGTDSRNFPTTVGAYDRSFNAGGNSIGSHGDMDAFITKISPQGQILWSTLFGGPNYDRAYAIEVDQSGNVIIAGRAGPGLPTTLGALQTAFQGDNKRSGGYGKQDGFVAKISADGSSLMWSSYIGGSGRGFIRDFDIDSSGNIYLGMSSVSGLPANLISTNAVQKTLAIGSVGAAFIKLLADGGGIGYGTYFGGSPTNPIFGQNPSVRVTQTSEIVIMLVDNSDNIPVTAGAFQSRNAGSSDLVVAKFSASMKLLYCTFLGGSLKEQLETHTLAIDNSTGEAIIAVATQSSDFPTTSGSYQPIKKNPLWASAMVRLSNDGQRMVDGTFFDGNKWTGIEGISVAPDGQIVFSGPTLASNLPVTNNAIQVQLKGIRDGYFARISADLKSIDYLTYFGGNGDDQIRTSIMSPNGQLLIGGHAHMEAGFPLLNAFDTVVTGTGYRPMKMNAGFYGLFQF